MTDNGSTGSSGRVLSPEEIMNQFRIEMSPSPDTAELQRINADVANKYQTAAVEYTKARHKHSQVERRHGLVRDEITLQVAQEERAKGRGKALNSEEKKSQVNKRLSEHKIARTLDSVEYYVEVWNSVMKTLKFVSSRIGDAIIEDASEKKMMGAFRPSSEPSTPPSNPVSKTDIWRSNE